MYVTTSLRDKQLIIAEWTMISFTLSLVLLRVYFRTVQTRWRLADTFVVIAWAFCVVQVSCETERYRLGADSQYAAYLLTLEKAILSAKLQLVQSISYFSCQYAVKGSMLAFYCEIINHYTMPRSFRLLRVLVVLVFASYLFSICTFLFWCKNISDNWRLDRFYRKCFGAGYDYRISSAVLSMHLVTDLLIYLFPILILRKLHLPRRKKIGAAIMFFLGLISLVNALVYFLMVFVVGGKAGLWIPFLSIWEETSALVVACCPSFKAFLKARLKPRLESIWKRSKEWLSTLSQKKSSTRGTDGEGTFELGGVGRSDSRERLSQNYSLDVENASTLPQAPAKAIISSSKPSVTTGSGSGTNRTWNTTSGTGNAWRNSSATKSATASNTASQGG